MKILKLTKENHVLALKEVESISKTPGRLKQHGMFVEADVDYARLTYLEAVYEKISEEKAKSEHGSFKFTFENTPRNIHHPAIEILIKNGRSIDLKHPDIEYSLIALPDHSSQSTPELFKKIYVNQKSFLRRHPNFRPGFHPGACTPKFARVLVNLTGIQKGQSLLDPFCGTGGILLEAADMGIKITGSDIDEQMLRKAKLNLDAFKMTARLQIRDATKINEDYDAIATELPFGKATILKGDVTSLLQDFLASAHKHVPTVVVGLPIGKGFNDSYKTPGYKIVFEHDIYIHKSLSKRILVLKRILTK